MYGLLLNVLVNIRLGFGSRHCCYSEWYYCDV